jgi:hypothetical protein
MSDNNFLLMNKDDGIGTRGEEKEGGDSGVDPPPHIKRSTKSGTGRRGERLLVNMNHGSGKQNMQPRIATTLGAGRRRFNQYTVLREAILAAVAEAWTEAHLQALTAQRRSRGIIRGQQQEWRLSLAATAGTQYDQHSSSTSSLIDPPYYFDDCYDHHGQNLPPPTHTTSTTTSASARRPTATIVSSRRTAGIAAADHFDRVTSPHSPIVVTMRVAAGGAGYDGGSVDGRDDDMEQAKDNKMITQSSSTSDAGGRRQQSTSASITANTSRSEQVESRYAGGRPHYSVQLSKDGSIQLMDIPGPWLSIDGLKQWFVDVHSTGKSAPRLFDAVNALCNSPTIDAMGGLLNILTATVSDVVQEVRADVVLLPLLCV